MLKKVKSIDFKITASGHGVVNWNGGVSIKDGGSIYNNHNIPKLVGMMMTNDESKVISETIDFTKHPLFVSSNCIRHYLFKNQYLDSFGLSSADDANKLIASLSGLMRGYVHAESGIKRKGPLMIENFVDILGNGTTYEKMTNSAAYDIFPVDKNGKIVKNKDADTVVGHSYQKSPTSLFSKTTFTETSYVAYGSISIEDLSFICLDAKFGRKSATDKDEVIENINKYLQSINHSNLNPEVVFSESYQRIGSAFLNLKMSEAGIVLNDDAIHLVVLEFIKRLNSLYIQQGKGYMFVDSLQVHLNDTNIPMAIKRFPDSGYGVDINSIPNKAEYEKYYISL